MTGPEAGTQSSNPRVPQSRVDTTVPHPARRYNYWLGGKDNFEPDRASGDAIAAMFPTVRTAAIENRRFLRRAVRYLATQAGVRQFLDVGTGIPAPDNTHEVAQAAAPTSRVVYVDNDPIVMAHARALLGSGPEGATAYLEADLRQGTQLLRQPEMTQTLDLSQPVALLLVAILHFLDDADDPYTIVADLVRELPSGSYLVASHAAVEVMAPDMRAKAEAAAASGQHGGFQFRTRAEFSRFFDGMELVPPGVVSVADWRADDEPQPRPTPAEVGGYGAVARIP
jgi:hypothetical protein